MKEIHLWKYDTEGVGHLLIRVLLWKTKTLEIAFHQHIVI